MGKATFGFKAADGKVTQMTVNVPTVDETNWVSIAGDIDEMFQALSTISASASSNVGLAESMAGNGYDPASVGGVRGEKAIIRWYAADEGPAGQYGSNEIGAVDRSEFTLENGRYVLKGAAYDAIKASFDSLAVTENGNAVSVYEVEYVTRTL